MKTINELESIYGKLMAEAENVKEHIRNRKRKVDKYIKKYIRTQINNVYDICLNLDLPSNSCVTLYFTKVNVINNRLAIYTDGSSYNNYDISDKLQTYLNPENIKSLFDKLFRIKKLCFSTNYLDNLPKAYTFILCSPFCQDITKIIAHKILFFLPRKKLKKMNEVIRK
jgi:hypothetical protein